MDSLTGLWRTFKWYHNEFGIAFGIDKPLLILKDERVVLGGLPAYLAESGYTPSLDFNIYGINELRPKLSAIMPGFREWVETKRRLEYFNTLKQIAVGGFAVVGAVTIISCIIGSLSDSSRKIDQLSHR